MKRRLRVVLATTMVVGCMLEIAIAEQVVPKVKMIEVDGAKNPDHIPEYLAWEYAFRFLSTRNPETLAPASGIDIEAKLPRPDVLLIVKTSREQSAIRAKCQQDVLEYGNTLKAQQLTAAYIKSESQRRTVDCRVQTLAASDALLAALPGTSASYLRSWVYERRKAIVSWVPEPDMTFYRLPR